MKTLTIRQPWAWAIARGHKDIENRGWTTKYRGPLAIHAAKKPDDGGIDPLTVVVHTIRAQGGTHPARLVYDLPYSGCGVVVATVRLWDVCTASLNQPTRVCGCGPWANPYSAHWRLADAVVLPEPFEATGRLGLWDCEDLPAHEFTDDEIRHVEVELYRDKTIRKIPDRYAALKVLRARAASGGSGTDLPDTKERPSAGHHCCFGGAVRYDHTTSRVLAEVREERAAQDARWGVQSHPMFPSNMDPESYRAFHLEEAEMWKRVNHNRIGLGLLAMDGILLEEVEEALSEPDPVKLRAELVQVAAVAVMMIEAHDRRVAGEQEKTA